MTDLLDEVAPRIGREVVRIPRLRRLSYLRALLSVLGEHGGTKEQARIAVLEIANELAASKAAALGRKEPKASKGDQLVEQCVQMGTRLGLVQRTGRRLSRTRLGTRLIEMGPLNDRPLLFRLLWETFPYFRTVVGDVCARADGFRFPVNRSDGLFARAAKEQGLNADHISFEIVRDLATDLLVLNWHPIVSEASADQKVYAVGQLCSGTDPTAAATNDAELLRVSNVYERPVYRAVAPNGVVCCFTGNLARMEDFEQVLWRLYLQLTDRVPRFPVLYPVLRDSVCAALRIPDPHFDACVQELILRPRRLDVYPAEGILDYSSKAAVTYKQVPPRTPNGQFMTFLKIDRKQV